MGAQERDVVARKLFADMAQTLDVRRLVVVDESSSHLDMYPSHARAPEGERAVDQARRNFGQNATLLAALRLEGMTAPWVVDGAVNTAVFEAYVQTELLPILQPGDLVVVDNLSSHKSSRVQCLIEQAGAHLLFLPAYSPDLSPIEEAFSKIKTFLRRARAQTFDALLDAIAAALDTITPADALAYFLDCGYLNVY